MIVVTAMAAPKVLTRRRELNVSSAIGAAKRSKDDRLLGYQLNQPDHLSKILRRIPSNLLEQIIA
jgi:hypothetical protein